LGLSPTASRPSGAPKGGGAAVVASDKRGTEIILESLDGKVADGIPVGGWATGTLFPMAGGCSVGRDSGAEYSGGLLLQTASVESAGLGADEDWADAD
jgi:hypothetical protein